VAQVAEAERLVEAVGVLTDESIGARSEAMNRYIL